MSTHAAPAWPVRLVSLLARRGDLLLGLVVVAVIALMVLPIPLFLLDLLIATNFAASIGLLMLAFYVPSALALTTFPSLLLFTTLLRLSLNIASTKLILLDGDAGRIIDTFGHLVVGGNVVVGLVVFSIIAVVQFIVIAKGAERVAEVGARFTLDALPGKQMSIDADLRSGLIDKAEARRRRVELEQESKLHGAMDGAMKFVKGDAIAALVIALINIVAGIAIGMAMRDMALPAALATYTVLTVGDGMVSQIPSLFVSIAAGIVITRVGAAEGGDENLGTQVVAQVMRHPSALLMAGVVLAGFVLVPGFPRLQFLLLALAFVGLGGLLRWNRRQARSRDRAALPSMAREGTLAVPDLIDSGVGTLAVPLAVRLAGDLRERLDPAAFDAALQAEREALRRQLGLPFPGLRMRYDDGLPAGRYAIDVQELPVAEGAFGDEAGAAARLARHVAEVTQASADAFLGLQEVQALLARAEAEMPDLAAEVQRALPVARIAEVLRRLVQEGVSIRYLREICESLVAWGPREKDVVMLTECVRVDLGRLVSARHLEADGTLRAVVLDGDAEAVVREGIQQGAAGGFLALPHDTTERLVANAGAVFAALPAGLPRVLVTSMDVRRYLKRMLDGTHAPLTVLSFQELPAQARVLPQGVLDLQPLPRQRAA